MDSLSLTLQIGRDWREGRREKALEALEKLREVDEDAACQMELYFKIASKLVPSERPAADIINEQRATVRGN